MSLQRLPFLLTEQTGHLGLQEFRGCEIFSDVSKVDPYRVVSKGSLSGNRGVIGDRTFEKISGHTRTGRVVLGCLGIIIRESLTILA